LNRAGASIAVRPLAVSDGRPTLRWLVPSFSGAHSSVVDGVQAEAVKREGTEWQMRQVGHGDFISGYFRHSKSRLKTLKITSKKND